MEMPSSRVSLMMSMLMSAGLAAGINGKKEAM